MPAKGKAVTPTKQSTDPSSMKLTPATHLLERIEQIYGSIAHRAFEIFRSNGQAFGHDLAHWFQAESELLHPVHIDVAESDGGLTVRAEVPGFTGKELIISVEPRRLTIVGKRETKGDRKDKKPIYTEHCSDQILRVIDLPVEVEAEKAAATLKDGILVLKVPRAATPKEISQGATPSELARLCP